MKSVAINEVEWAALEGLPHLQFRLYMVLRWYVDIATGIVGLKRGISYQHLAEELYVEPVRGRHAADAGSPTTKAIRSALQRLESAGLVVPCGNGEVLVFKLPKAKRVSARPNDEGQMRGRGHGHDQRQGESLAGKGISTNEGQHERQGGKRDEGHTSGIRKNPLSVEAIAAAQPLTVEPDLSTGEVLQLLLPSDIAEFIRASERLRGKLPKVASTDALLADWVKTGLTQDQLREAYSMAVNDREVRNNHSPINVGFLDIFVKRVLKGRRVSRGIEGAVTSVVWHRSPEGISRKAEELGVEPKRDAETLENFMARVSLAESEAMRARRKGDARR